MGGNSGECRGPTIGLLRMSVSGIGAVDFELCAVHAPRLSLASTSQQAIQKDLSAIGLSLPRGIPRFRYRPL